MNKAELEQSLKQFPGVDAERVDVEGNGKLVAKIVVRAFDGVDEADRQEKVYEFLRARFSEQELESVEYIITGAPGDPTQ